MDVLVSMGTNAAYIYSIISIVHRRQQYTSTGKDVGGSDFFETAALLITFISLGKLLESHAKGKTSEVCLVHRITSADKAQVAFYVLTHLILIIVAA